MKILIINLKNPITHNEINRIENELSSSKTFDFLIIDAGSHDFESIEVLHFLKIEMIRLTPQLKQFSKIAFVHPPGYKNESDDPEKYNFFSSREETKKWFLQ